MVAANDVFDGLAYQGVCDKYCFVIYIERHFKEVKIFQVKIFLYP